MSLTFLIPGFSNPEPDVFLNSTPENNSSKQNHILSGISTTLYTAVLGTFGRT